MLTRYRKEMTKKKQIIVMTRSKRTQISVPLLVIFLMCFGGCRDLQYFPDMHYSTAIDAQKADPIGQRKGNMLPPENTIPYKASGYSLTNALDDYPRADWVLKDPLSGVEDKKIILEQGGFKYDIYCAPCHGLTGKGDGPIQKKWVTIRPLVRVEGKNVDVPALRWGTGRIYHVIRVGIRSMGSYASQIKDEDRWRIAHYVKYLQTQE